MRAATLVAMNTFTMRWEHQAFETMAGCMEERVNGLQARGEAGEILQIDEEKLHLKVTEALERKFEAKLAEMAGVSSLLKLSDETAFTLIVVDQVQAGLQKPIKKMEREAEAAFRAADEVARQCDDLLGEANETMKNVKEKVEKLTEGLSNANSRDPKDRWFDDIEQTECSGN